MSLKLESNYSKLPEKFYQKINPTPVKDPHLIYFNSDLVRNLGLDSHFNLELISNGSQNQKLNLNTDKKNNYYSELALIFSGNQVLENSTPIAMAYAGHQFGNFVPQLGDGRAILLGELPSKSGTLYDVHLKGSGQTKYSRGGDGRSALGPAIRECLVSEAMFHLGIATTRGLALVTTGEQVERETNLPGAILVRMAKGHVRFGTFEYFAAQNDYTAVQILTDYCIDRFYPECREDSLPYLSFYKKIVKNVSEMVAHWMSVGFIHGVMNTDNMSITTETIDYGPCAFLEEYDPLKVFSSIDRRGRYAYGNQSEIAKWNLHILAICLRKLLQIDDEKMSSFLDEAYDDFDSSYQVAYTQLFSNKLGIKKNHNRILTDRYLNILHDEKKDFTKSFRDLSNILRNPSNEIEFLSTFENRKEISTWIIDWKAFLISNNTDISTEKNKIFSIIANQMDQVNPIFIPRNHLVEKAIQKATKDNDFDFFFRLLDAIKKPYIYKEEYLQFSHPAKQDEKVEKTFCGT